jgi:hypothetical protein
MSGHDSFELHRLIDGLVYRFHRQTAPDGRVGYRREDRDLWIVWSERWGWVSVLPEEGAIAGRPWEVPREEQGDAPPEGTWVSRKGEKSYVYQLLYVRHEPAVDTRTGKATGSPAG